MVINPELILFELTKGSPDASTARKMVASIVSDTLKDPKKITEETLRARTNLIALILENAELCPIGLSQIALLRAASNLEELWFILCEMSNINH